MSNGDDAVTDTSGLTNPKRPIKKREAAAGLDAGDLPGPTAGMLAPKGDMPQGQFSKYPDTKFKKAAPPAAMLKKRESKE